MTDRASVQGTYKAEWSTVWPTVPGWYWFFGFEFGEDSGKLKLVPVEVWGPVRNSQGGESMVYVAGGGSYFMSQQEAVGAWTPMGVPEVPKT